MALSPIQCTRYAMTKVAGSAQHDDVIARIRTRLHLEELIPYSATILARMLCYQMLPSDKVKATATSVPPRPHALIE